MKVTATRVPKDSASKDRALTRAELLVHPLSPTEWRISNSRLSPENAFSLLGFIEKKNDSFEAMQLGRGFEWFSFSTLEDAIDHFLELDRSDCAPDEYVLSWMPSFA